MKKNLFILSAIAVAAAALVSCNKIQETVVNEEPQGVPFEITASSIQTKTVNDGMSTTWLDTDEINLMHAVHGVGTYYSDGKFTAKAAGASVGFTGTLKSGSEPTSGNTYDWYAVYPYKSAFTTPDGTKTVVFQSTQTQNGKDSKAHLADKNCPVAGNVLDVAYDAQPVINMENLASVAKVHVTNGLAENPIVVYSVSITASAAKIAGEFNLNLTGAHPAITGDSGSNTITLNVTNCPKIEHGTSADFYIALKPFTAAASTTITVKVVTNRGTKSVTSSALVSDFSFVAGSIHQLSFNYDVDSPSSIPFSIDGNATADDYAAKDGLYISSGIKPNGYTNDAHKDYRAQWSVDGAYLQVYFNAAAGKVTFPVKMVGGATTSTMTLSGSVDGYSFTDIMDFEISGASGSILNFDSGLTPIDDSYRFLRLTYAKGSNIGVGTISIAAPSADPEIEATDITGIDALGVIDATKTYAVNFADDITVTCDGTIVTSATKTSAGNITYTVAPYYHYSPATRQGTITLTSPSKSINKVINVNQAKDDFKVNNGTSSITITIPKDESSVTFTLLSQVMSWNSTTTPGDGMNLSVSPSSGAKNASAVTLTVSSTTAATGSEQTLGTIVVYRNDNASDTQKRTITVKKAANVAGVTWVETPLGSLTTSDEFVIVGNGYAMSNNNGTGSAPAATGVTIADGKITSAVTDSYVWTLTGNSSDGYTFYPKGSTTTWLYCNTEAASGSNNNMRVGTGARKVFVLKTKSEKKYLVTKDTYTERYVCNYNNSNWRGYVESSIVATDTKFYKKTVTP